MALLLVVFLITSMQPELCPKVETQKIVILVKPCLGDLVPASCKTLSQQMSDSVLNPHVILVIAKPIMKVFCFGVFLEKKMWLQELLLLLPSANRSDATK